ncbi:hypothetical protein [Pontibacter mangrovi]|uniref:Uncharacterized protein n=1 Tax=Pontibacter mangrovi TaxID=2589816 RepID=A0A501WBQ8_9BACT|nr:hypothetical protein [Pontibacter mangrovi]TPE44247.1 hypothetical protein FJM65_08785 [Pontibacter mangrovi]
MHPTTTNISNWFKNPAPENQLQTFIERNPNFTSSETTIEEAAAQLEVVKNHVLIAIENGEFDKISFINRNQMATHLTSITGHLNIIAQHSYNVGHSTVKNQAVALITNILHIYELFIHLPILNNSKGLYSYKEEVKELVKGKKQFEKNLAEIQKAEGVFNETQGLLTNVKQQVDEWTKTNATLKSEYKTVINIKKQIDALYQDIQTSVQDINNKKLVINSVHTNAQSIEDTIEASGNKIKKFIEQKTGDIQFFIDTETDFFSKELKALVDKTSSIVVTNLEQQRKVNQLLEGANAGRLYRSFWLRKKQLEEKQKYWLGGIISINILIVCLSILLVNGSEWLGVNPLDLKDIDGAFIFKLVISIPLLFLDYFIVSQYNSRAELIEKYSFKSALSLSLLSYNEMIKENAESDESREFINKTVDLIYESPFDTPRAPKGYNRFLQKIEEHTHNAVSKGIEKVTS